MMRIFLVSAALVLWLFPCGAQFAPETHTPVTPGTPMGNRTFTLLKPGGAPAAGAKVLVRSIKGYSFTPGSRPRMEMEKTFTADAQGRVTFDFPIGAGAPYTPFSSYALVFAPGCCVTALPLSEFSAQITLLPEKTMEVKVTLNGQPAPGADVVLVSIVDIFQFNNPQCAVSTPQLVFRSGQDGTARIPVINTGKFQDIAITQLQAIVTLAPDDGKAPSYCAYPVTIPISPKSTTISVALQPAVTLTGTVTAPNGQPIKGAVVSHASIPLPLAVTDAKGQFRVCGIPKRARNVEMLTIVHPDYARALVRVDAAETTPLVAVLQPRVTVRGRVIDAETGRSINAVFTIRMSYLAAPGAMNAGSDAEMFTTAADGTFSIRIPEQSAILAFGQGYDGAKFMVEKKFTDRETVDLKVQKGAAAGPRR